MEDPREIRRASSETMHECTLYRCVVANANHMDGFVCSIRGGESEVVTLAGMGRTCTDMNCVPCGRAPRYWRGVV
jgi:hypothetical protein